MEIKGFCKLKSLDNVFIGYDKTSDPEGYNKIALDSLHATFLPIMDVAVDNSGFLVLSPDGKALLDVQNLDSVSNYFMCTVSGDVILPPNISSLDKMILSGKRLSRKGGYNHIIRNMVIMNSLRLGEFNDDFLFQKQ